MSVVFFCVGAAKAGTSWLHRQLLAHPECGLRTIKELHYFNAVEYGRLDQELKKHVTLQKDMLDRLAEAERFPNPHKSLVLDDRARWIDVLEKGEVDYKAYLNYLREGAEDARLVGDMTPAYALLPVSRLKAMASLASDVRFLYLLRDPVERLWSHVRMMAARRDKAGRAHPQNCAKILARTLDGTETEISKRSDYHGAIERLIAAVRPDKILFDVFEDMVAAGGFDRICRFLGLSTGPYDPVPVHVGQGIDMTAEQKLAARAWLEPQYVAAKQVLGRVPSSWHWET